MFQKVAAAGLLATAAAVSAVALAAPAGATSTDFLLAAAAAGFHNDYAGPAGVLADGQQVCAWKYQGYTRDSVVRATYLNEDFTYSQADVFVTLADNYLC